MPPKKDAKTTKPSVQKVVQDKTFGIKNKKGGKAQKAIAQLASQASASGTPEQKRREAEKAQREAEKKAAEAAKKEVAQLFKPVQSQKVPFGVDPKSVLCVYFKNGNCEKGARCKFSHDLSVERKSQKKNIYEDDRAEEEERKKREETSENWDEEKLRSVVLSKQGNPKTTTDKVCKFFIDAVENGKYGWFWQCPNGGNDCKYKHSLPPGFVLKTKEQRAAEKKALVDEPPPEILTLEDFLGARRHETLTPVTDETFKKWKLERMSKKEAVEETQRAKEATGRVLFEKGIWRNEIGGDEESDGEDSGGFDLAALRKETQALEGDGDDIAELKSYESRA